LHDQHVTRRKKRRKRKKKRKEKHIGAKPDQTIIHASSKKKIGHRDELNDIVKTQLIPLDSAARALRKSRAADACEICVSNIILFFLYKIKNASRTK